MNNQFAEIFKIALGLETAVKLGLIMCLRGIIVYLFGILLVRFNKKFIVIRTSFNFILYIMLGSIAAVAITVDGMLIPVICTVIFLAFVNRVMGALEFYFPSFEQFFKGRPVLLIRNGEIQWDMMKKNYITKDELLNELQSQMHMSDLSQIDTAILTSDRIHFSKK